MDHIRRVVFGLGSNVGDREKHIDAAVEALGAVEGVHVMGVSPLYETAAEGGPPQGAFLNGAVLVLTAIEVHDLLRRALAIEAQLGRVRGEKNAPRTIDIDLLWLEGEVVKTDELTVPHPRLPERAFALRPLLDLAPDARDFEQGTEFAELAVAKITLRVVRDGR